MKVVEVQVQAVEGAPLHLDVLLSVAFKIKRFDCNRKLPWTVSGNKEKNLTFL